MFSTQLLTLNYQHRQTGRQTDTHTENEYLVKKTEKNTAQRCNKLSSNIVFSVSLRCLCSWQITSENGWRIKPTYRSNSVGTFFFQSKNSFGPPSPSSLYLTIFPVTHLFYFRGVHCFKITTDSISFADVPSKMERRWCVVWVALCFIYIYADEIKRKSSRLENRIQKFVHFCRYSGLGLY